MSDNRQKLLNRIKALMQKTVDNGCTEAEAMAALSMAQTMMDAYEVTEDEINQTKQEKAIHETMKDMRDPHHIRHNLSENISRFTNTKCFTSGNRKKFNFVGLQSDIEFTIWLLEHLTLFVQKELKNYIWANKYTSLEPSRKRKIINGFVHGCTQRINERLKELVESSKVKANQNTNALMVVKDQLIVDKLNQLGLNFVQPRNRSFRMENGAYEYGKSAGDKATFGRPVEQGGMLRLKWN